MLKRLRRLRSLRVVAATAAAGALLVPPQVIGAQTPAAAVSSITIVSSPADSASYQAGETIQFSVQFTSAVRVAGSPVLAVDVGGTKRRALFDSVRGSEALFAYPVTGDDVDTDGVSVGASALTLGPGGAVTDSQGQAANLAHAAVPADAAHRVNMSVVTIEAAGTEPVPEDEPATYILRRTGSLSRALTVVLDHELDDALDDPDPDVQSGDQPYVFSFRVPRTVTFQPGQDSAPLEVPVNNDAEIELADGSLTMFVADDADYLVGRPAAATRILTDNNDVRVRVSSARHLGTTVEGPRSLNSSLTLQTLGPRDEPPDPFHVSISTKGLTASSPVPEGLLTPYHPGDYVLFNKMVAIEPSEWQRADDPITVGDETFRPWSNSIRVETELIDDDVPEPPEQFQFLIERAPFTPVTVFATGLLPHRSTVTILDDDLAWEVEVLHVDGDTAVGLGEGQTIDTFEDGDESGDLVLELVATTLYPVGTFTVVNDIRVEMELVGDTEAGLEATYLTDFRRRDESGGTAATQTVVLSGRDRTTIEEAVGHRLQIRKRVSIRTVDDSLVEGTEDFRIRLSKTSDDAYVTFNASQFDVRILDNDAPAVSIAADADRIEEGENVTFTLTRPAANSTEALPVTLSIVESAEYIDRSGGFVVPTTLTFAAGESTVAATVPTQDDRVADGDGTIVATLQPGGGYSYTAEGRSASVDVFEGLPELTLTGVTVRENRSGSVAVSLSQASDEAVSFSWTTADGQGDRAAIGGASAGSGIDYRSGSGTVEIDAGDTSAAIAVRTFNDDIDEPDETFRVELSNIEGASVATPRATVSIRDADDPPQIKVENGTCPNLDDPADTDTTCTEGDDGHMNFDVWLRVDGDQGASGKEVSVDWAARDYAASANTGTAGKARAGSDYVAGSGTLTFAPGVGRLTVQVELLDDEIGENTERFSFRLRDLVNVEQYDSFAYGEILDDGDTGTEEPDTETPTLSVDDVSVAEGAGTARVQVKMSRAASHDVSFDYATADGTAGSPADYTAAAGTATVTAGALSVLIDIPVTQDQIYETDETFTVALANPTEAALDSDPSATVTILDDDRRPSLSVRDASAGEESGPLRFTVERTGASTVAVSAQWATADGTAESPADYTGATGTVTIGPGDTTATVSVTLVADAVDESDETMGVALSSPVDATIGRGTATGTILDNDEAGGGATPRLVVSPTALIVDEGDSAGESYTVKLASAPSGNVAVTVSGDSGSDLTVSPAALEFTTGNWETAQTVTVTAGHDDDHTNDTATLTNTAAGGGYSGASPVAVAVTVADDDRPALVISPTSVTVDEGDTSGASAGKSYTVRLATQPSANVAVTITGTAGTDVSLDTSSMTFTSDTWNTPQVVRVTAGHDDDADDDEVTLVHTAAGGGYTSVRGTVAVTVDDDDTARGAGLLIDPTSVEMPEGGGSTYTVRLATEPTEDVTVTITGTDADLTVLSVRPMVLTFTAADWDTPRTVALGAGTDADTDDDQMTLTHTAASDDTAYDGLSATLAVKVIDDASTDHAGLEVNPTQLSVDEGEATGYNVRLRSQPSGDVTVTVTVTGAEGGNLEGVPDTLTFTDVDWGVWQSVAMIARHDPDIDDARVTLTHTAAGGSYGGQSADVTVTIVDDDTAGVSLDPTRVTVTEGGAGATYTAVLDSQPSERVTVTIGGAGSEVSLDETSLEFTSDTWNTPQTVKVTAVDDDVDEDTERVTLTHSAASDDDDYDGLAETLEVAVVDDDTAGVVAPAAVTVTEGEDGVGYPVKLSTEPAEDVTVTIGGVPHDDITLDKTTLTFTSGNWDTPQTVTVTAVDDDAVEDPERVTLPHRTASTGDDYDDVAVVAITTVTVRDNDNPPVQVSFGQAAYSVIEGETVDVSVVLAAAAERAVTVTFSHTNQGDAEGVDYSTPQRLTFGSGETSKTFPFTAVPDDVADRGESVKLEFDTLPQGYAAGSPDTTTVSITDAADAPEVSVSFGASSYSVAEGSSVTVTVELSADPGRAVTVPVTHTAQGDASDADYSGVPESVTFASGDTSETFTFTAASDSVDDDGESVLLGFGSELPAGFAEGDPDKATVSITDDPADVPSVQVFFEKAAYSVVEGEMETVTVELDVAPERQVVVPITATRQDGAGLADYSLSATSVTFAAGETTATFMFSAFQDGDDDDGESVVLGFGDLPDRVSEGSPEEATVAIVDDDDPWVELFFDQASYSVDEGSSVTVTVRLSADPERTVTVPITVARQGGASPGDYSGVPASVTFAADETSKTFTFTAVDDSVETAVDDSVDDDGESVVLGFGDLPDRVSAPDTTARPDTATVNIADDDDPQVQVSFGAESYTVAEGAEVTVTVELSAAPERQVVVDLTHTAQGDTSSGDYSLSAASVTFAADETSKTFTFTAASDSVDDDGESVVLGFGSPLPAGFAAGDPDTATVNITDDDHPQVQVSFGAGSYTVAEGASATVTVELSAAPERQVVVDLTHTAQGDTSSGDYSLSAASVTFAADETSKTFTFTAASDSVDDDGESVVLGFGSPLPAGFAAGDPDTATVNITDDDHPAVQVSFGAGSYTVAEGASATVTVELSAAPERQVVVDLTHTAQGDTSSGDYSLSAASVTFAADETSKTFTFTAASDSVDDDGESVVLGFGSPLPAGFAAGDPDTATVNITDDDHPAVQVSFGAGSYTVAEGASATVTVELSAAPERQVVVDLTHTAQGDTSSGDYSLSAASVTFAADETSKTFTFTAASDSVDDDGESVVLGFGSPLPAGFAAGDPDTATVNITDDPDDVPSVAVSFGAGSYTVAEGASATVTVELSAAPERQVVVDLTHTAQGDTSSGDYSLSAASVTFAADETSKTFTFTAAADDVDDDGESVVLGFGSPLPAGFAAGDPDTATVNITDDPDDVPSVAVSFGAGSYTVAEGASATVTVELSAAPERQVVVDLTHTAQGDTSSGDYSLSAASVTFAADETSKTFTFTAASDSVDDDGESVVLGFGSPLPAGFAAGDPDTATVNITDDPDDVPSVAVSFGAGSYTVAEGASATVTVELSAAPERQVVVDLTHTGQGDTSSGDYSLSAASVTFAADETSKTFTFTAASDDVDDDGDSVLLGFDTPLPTGVTEGSPDEATVNITDDPDDVPSVSVSFGAASYTVAEGSTVTVSVVLSAAPERQVEVDLTHTGQGDTSSGDYSLSATSVTFAADETSKTFTLTAASDDVDDDGDSVLLGFDTPLPTGVTEGSPDEATVTITDDDHPAVQVSFGAGSYTVAEGSTVTVSVELSAAPERQVVVDLTHTGQGDTSSGDYSLSAASVTFAADETSKTFTLTAASDDVDDDGDSVLLGFDTPLPTGVTEGSPDEATVNITDDPDDVPSVSVSFGAASYTVAEGSTVTVSVVLSAAPERQVEVDLTHTGQGDTSSGDYSLSAASVTFAADETSKTFTLTAASDDVDDDGDSVLLGFDTPLPTGVTEGSPDEATVTITDDDHPAVQVSFGAGSYTVAEGSTVTVSVELSAAPERQVEVDLTHTAQGDTSSGDYSLSAASVTFAADETSKTFTLTAASDDVDDDGDSVLLGFDTPLPTGVTEGSPDEATVNITDDPDDVPSVSVSFGAASYTVAEGASVTVSVVLSAAPERQVEVDLTHTGQGDTSSGDYSLSAASVTFAADETSKTFTLTAASDDVDDDGDSVLLGFDTPLPTGVTEGSPDEATVTITDDDHPAVQVSFGAGSYTVAEALSVTVSVELSAAPERQVEVDLTHTAQGDTSSGDYSLSAASVTFAADETSKTFTLTAASDDVDDDGDSVLLGFDTPLPTGVTEGSPDEATVNITDDPDDVPSVSVSFGAASYTVAEGASVTVSVVLSAAPERQVEVDLTHTGQGDTSSGDYSLSATSVTFARTRPPRRSRSPRRQTTSTTTATACCWGSTRRCRQGSLRAPRMRRR